ncbi:unnamed protein product [Malus baccata var. baccata]
MGKMGSSVMKLPREGWLCLMQHTGRVTLKLKPIFKQSITYLSENNYDLGDSVLVFGMQYEFADMIWYPSQHKLVYQMDNCLLSNTSGNGMYDSIIFRATYLLMLAITEPQVCFTCS